MIKQFTIFLENRPGRLASFIQQMETNGIRVLAMGIAEAGNYGIVRCIVDNDEKALAVMKDANMAVNLSDVMIVDLSKINAVVQLLESESVNVDYAYTMDGGKVVIKVNDEKKALKAMEKAGLKAHPKRAV